MAEWSGGKKPTEHRKEPIQNTGLTTPNNTKSAIKSDSELCKTGKDVPSESDGQKLHVQTVADSLKSTKKDAKYSVHVETKRARHAAVPQNVQQSSPNNEFAAPDSDVLPGGQAGGGEPGPGTSPAASRGKEPRVDLVSSFPENTPRPYLPVQNVYRLERSAEPVGLSARNGRSAHKYAPVVRNLTAPESRSREGVREGSSPHCENGFPEIVKEQAVVKDGIIQENGCSFEMLSATRDQQQQEPANNSSKGHGGARPKVLNSSRTGEPESCSGAEYENVDKPYLSRSAEHASKKGANSTTESSQNAKSVAGPRFANNVAGHGPTGENPSKRDTEIFSEDTDMSSSLHPVDHHPENISPEGTESTARSCPCKGTSKKSTDSASNTHGHGGARPKTVSRMGATSDLTKNTQEHVSEDERAGSSSVPSTVDVTGPSRFNQTHPVSLNMESVPVASSENPAERNSAARSEHAEDNAAGGVTVRGTVAAAASTQRCFPRERGPGAPPMQLRGDARFTETESQDIEPPCANLQNGLTDSSDTSVQPVDNDPMDHTGEFETVLRNPCLSNIPAMNKVSAQTLYTDVDILDNPVTLNLHASHHF